MRGDHVEVTFRGTIPRPTVAMVKKEGIEQNKVENVGNSSQESEGDKNGDFEGQADEEEEEEEDLEDANIDFYGIMGIPKQENGKIAGGIDRVRRAYHKLSMRWNPHNWPEDEWFKNSRKFRRVAISYLVLKDAELRRIYHEHGYSGLWKSEQYAQNSVFDVDQDELYEDFFAGKDPEVKEYLLMNSNDNFSDDSGGECEDETESEEESLLETVNVDPLQAGTGKSQVKSASVPPPPMPPILPFARPPSFLQEAGKPSGGDDPWKKSSVPAASSESTDEEDSDSPDEKSSSAEKNDLSLPLPSAALLASCGVKRKLP